VNRYQVRISVVEMKAFGMSAVVGGRTPDKLLDASFTTSDLDKIRDIVDGLIFEGIPETATEEERSNVSSTVTLPPTVEELGDVVILGEGYRLNADSQIERIPGGKHSGNCSCKGCEPILPGEIATIQVPPLNEDGEFEPPIGRDSESPDR
jgi:hypothetical protein